MGEYDVKHDGCDVMVQVMMAQKKMKERERERERERRNILSRTVRLIGFDKRPFRFAIHEEEEEDGLMGLVVR